MNIYTHSSTWACSPSKSLNHETPAITGALTINPNPKSLNPKPQSTNHDGTNPSGVCQPTLNPK